MKTISIMVSCICLLVTSGCSLVPSTGQRAMAVGAGAGAGGVLGYALGHKSPGWGLAGAAAGALATGVAMGKDDKVIQEGFDDGYIQGQSDAIKRQYFLRVALESTPKSAEDLGQTVYYKIPGPTVTVDGRRLQPHTVVIPVKE